MSKFLPTLLVTLLSFVAFGANAADADNHALFTKKGMPEVSLSYRLDSPEADRNEVEFAFKGVQAALVKDGWVLVGNDWTRVSETTNQIRRKADRTAHCFVAVVGMYKTVHIEAKCGPDNLYGNGVFAQAEINPITSRDWRADIKKVPNILDQLHTYYMELSAKGLAEFVPHW